MDELSPSSPNTTVSSLEILTSSAAAPRGKRDFRGSVKANYNYDELVDDQCSDRSGGRCNSNSRGSDEELENGLSRKKLRLTKQQSAFLEDTFKKHNTLNNPKQKLLLAAQLNLRPRQVEVWFQNRRARTKLKKIEVDYEYLKRWCENLTEENRRLQKEVQELKSLKCSPPFYNHLPPTTPTICPRCHQHQHHHHHHHHRSHC